MHAAWTKIIPVSFSKKDRFEILCLKITIPRAAPTVPPIKAKPKSVFSGILLLCFTASLLSHPKIMNVKRLRKSTI